MSVFQWLFGGYAPTKKKTTPNEFCFFLAILQCKNWNTYARPHQAWGTLWLCDAQLRKLLKTETVRWVDPWESWKFMEHSQMLTWEKLWMSYEYGRHNLTHRTCAVPRRGPTRLSTQCHRKCLKTCHCTCLKSGCFFHLPFLPTKIIESSLDAKLLPPTKKTTVQGQKQTI